MARPRRNGSLGPSTQERTSSRTAKASGSGASSSGDSRPREAWAEPYARVVAFRRDLRGGVGAVRRRRYLVASGGGTRDGAHPRAAVDRSVLVGSGRATLGRRSLAVPARGLRDFCRRRVEWPRRGQVRDGGGGRSGVA